MAQIIFNEEQNKCINENDNIKIQPSSFKKLIGKKDSLWNELEHQDSQEFYTFLITKIEEECGNKIIIFFQIFP